MIAPKNAIHPMRYMLGGTMITPAQLKIFWKCIDEGAAIVGAAKTAGFSLPSGYNIHREQRGRELVKPKGKGQSHHWSQRAGLNKDPRTQGHQEANLPDPIALDDISLDARDALEDFHYFSERYFGRVPTPWRREAADVTLKLYDDEDKRHAVVNCPPGSGKTALFTHDIPAWLTMRDRAIRGVLGSWGMSTSGSYTRRLRTTFDRTALVPVSEDLIAKGMERQPSGVLAADFGRIKPLGQSDFWTANSFTVEQLDGRAPADKEPTWTAFGNGEIIGWRVDFLIFDDLVTVRKLDSEAEQQRTRRWWDDEVEKRLEPGGLLLLEGQRLGANDHYRYCLDKLDIDEDDLEVLDGFDPDFEEGRRRKYHHIIFKAHYEDKCSGGNSREPHHHPATAKPYPDGCLLDPARLKFRDLKREEAENPSRYMTVFQQEDTNPDQVLIPRHWIDGDADHPGCWDKDRDSWELPSLEGPVITVVSVDPSPTKNWAVQCVAEGQLVDLERGRVPIEDVVVGDLALTREGWRRVDQTHVKGVRRTLDVGLSSGETLRVTPDHRVATPSGWVEAGALFEGASLCTAAVSAFSGAGSADSSLGSVGLGRRVDVVAAVGVPVLAVGSGSAGHAGAGAFGVLGQGDGFEVFGVDATGVMTEVVDAESFGDVPFPEAVGEAVDETFARVAVDSGVAVAVLPLLPHPAPVGLGLRSGEDVCLVEVDPHGVGLAPVGAGFAEGDAGEAGFGSADRAVHVVSVTPGPTTRVYDLGVRGVHEFVASGVVVHNCWAYHPNSETYFLLDLFRGEMTQPSFLYGERDDYSGLLEDIRKDFEAMGRPLRHVIFEKNVAQRWFLQQPYVEKWKRKHQVRIHDHETHHRNKSDPKYGITMLRPLFEHGQIRLPGVQVPPGGSPKDYTGRRNSIKLTNELTRYSLLYGASGTDDQIMAAWMMAHKARTLRTPDPTSMPRLNQYVAGWMVKRKPAA